MFSPRTCSSCSLGWFSDGEARPEQPARIGKANRRRFERKGERQGAVGVVEEGGRCAEEASGVIIVRRNHARRNRGNRCPPGRYRRNRIYVRARMGLVQRNDNDHHSQLGNDNPEIRCGGQTQARGTSRAGVLPGQNRQPKMMRLGPDAPTSLHSCC